MTFELTNEQRKYFGLDPVDRNWDKVQVKPGFPTEGYLYFDGDRIKRHVVSVDFRYSESHYDEQTRDRTILLPKTSKGKEKKLSGPVLGERQPRGVYLEVSNHGVIFIGNHTSQTTFYSSRWDKPELQEERGIVETVTDFINESTPEHLSQIEKFRTSKRQRVRFRSGDYFSFKLSRTEFGFGRVLLDINKVRKAGLLPENHGLNLLMGPPVLIQLFAITSKNPYKEISELESVPKLPSDVMMDNLLLYGEYRIVGHKELENDDFEFPISYGRSIDRRPVVFLQWGLIHRELPLTAFDKFLVEDNTRVPEDSYSRKVVNPFGYYSIGFQPGFNTDDILRTMTNGVYSFDDSTHFRACFDLRNPKQRSKRHEILTAFGLNPNASYEENRKLTQTTATTDLINRIRN